MHPIINLLIPMRTSRGQNAREHHMTRARRVRAERWAVGMFLNRTPRISLPCVVVLTRTAPAQRPLDDDNLTGALKAVRDEVARWLGADDADPRIRWVYRQAKGGIWSVRIEACADDEAASEVQ